MKKTQTAPEGTRSELLERLEMKERLQSTVAVGSKARWPAVSVERTHASSGPASSRLGDGSGSE